MQNLKLKMQNERKSVAVCREGRISINTKIRYLLSFLVIYFSYSLIPIVSASEQIKSDPLGEEFLFFHHGGSYSPLKFVELIILNDGSGVTTFERMNKDRGEIPLQIDADELEALKTVVLATDFFSQPIQDTRQIIDAGTCTLRISINGKQHEIHFQEPYSSIEPLTKFVWGLIWQGIAISDLEEKRDAYSALEKVSGYLAKWTKVIQPETLRKPLKTFIHESKDSQQLLRAIEALSWVTTPEEWMGFVSQEINISEESRKNFLLKALSSQSSYFSIDNIPESHREILSPLFLRYLRIEYRNWDQFSKEKQEVYGSVISFLGKQRYTISLPVMMELIPEYHTGSIPWLHSALPRMGETAIEPLKFLLDSLDSNVRASAAEMLGGMLTMNPNWPMEDAISEEEQKRILEVMRTSIRPKLEKLAENDPNSWVRKAAKQSLDQIERGWNK